MCLLRQKHAEQLRTLLLLKEHHQGIINALDTQIATLLEVGYGIDITKEDWSLDLDKGVLSRANTDRIPRQ